VHSQLQEPVAANGLLNHSKVVGVGISRPKYLARSQIAGVWAEAWVKSKVRVRGVEIRMVKDIECICLELQSDAFRNLEILND
jgi:hypothetical protein